MPTSRNLRRNGERDSSSSFSPSAFTQQDASPFFPAGDNPSHMKQRNGESDNSSERGKVQKHGESDNSSERGDSAVSLLTQVSSRSRRGNLSMVE